MIASNADDPLGMIITTPYAAMTMAEHFRDKGIDTVLILDDLTTHAKYYREVNLLAHRFPGRNSYPGDIFFLHSRLLERAGNFKKSSITCLPVAEIITGDLSGYIQTNLMSMTDGHIFFDAELQTLGRRPPVNIFLSVTRVGLQAQTALLRDVATQITSFLLSDKKLREFLHFGAELSKEIKETLAKGDKIYELLSQTTEEIVPVNISVFLLGCIWAGYWLSDSLDQMKVGQKKLIDDYQTNNAVKSQIDGLVASANTLFEMARISREKEDFVLGIIKRK
jgi:F0F1-type ATP synthase alpha subunit